MQDERQLFFKGMFVSVIASGNWLVERRVVLYCFHVTHATVADFDNEFQLPEDLVAFMGFRKVPLDECFVDISLDDFTEGRVEQNDLSFSVLVICGEI